MNYEITRNFYKIGVIKRKDIKSAPETYFRSCKVIAATNLNAFKKAQRILKPFDDEMLCTITIKYNVSEII